MEQIKKEVLLGIGEVNIESFSLNIENLNLILNDAGLKEKINLKKEDSFEIDFPNISSLTQGVRSYLDGVIYHYENGFENVPVSILNKIDVIKKT